MNNITKIDLTEWATEELIELNLKEVKIKDLDEEQRDKYYIEIGNKYSFCRWLKEKGYLKDGVEV